jgi:hypothetical protein
MRQAIIMQKAKVAIVSAILIIAGSAQAHHSVPAEYGDVRGPTTYVEGKIVKVMWRNPHIFINIETTGGELTAGENWRLTTHPIHIMEDTYGFSKDDFAVGDSILVHGWLHIRGQPLMQMRAVQVNDGPRRSTLRFADLREIVAGTFKSFGIEPTPTLQGMDPARTGEETIGKLRDMGWLDEDGMVNIPEGYFDE